MTNIAQDNRWGIDTLVDRLRQLREQSALSRRPGEHPPKLPSGKVLKQVVDRLAAVLFPNLGQPELDAEGIDYYVGHTLDNALRQLQRQIMLELQFLAGEPAGNCALREQADAITRAFAASLPDIRVLLDSDIQAAYEGDPAAASPEEVLACYPGVTAMLHHRLAHQLYRTGAHLVARVISEISHSLTGIDIHPGAQIAESFFIDHGTGVVIGETCVIGRRVRLYQAVTLGAKRFAKDENGVLVKGNARHPIVEDDVVIYAGATILGRITIGRGSTIGGNVWLTYSVPAGSHISQAQARSEMFEAGGGI